jgi:inner membrane protein
VSARDCVALGFLAGAFPDADVVFSVLSPLAYLQYHRGITHSLLLLPLWALGVAWLWSRLRRNVAGFTSYFIVTALALFIHILGDLITSFGTLVLSPFSNRRFEWGTTFIIDLWLSGIVLAGLLASWLVRRSRVPAVVGLLALAAYVSFQWAQLHEAERVGEQYAREQGFDDYRVVALPRPVSPFNWMVVIEQPQTYHYAFVNLRRHSALTVAPDDGFIRRLDSAYVPTASAQWERVFKFGAGATLAVVDEAWQQPSFWFFRWFAALPMLAEVEQGNPSTCVWFKDLRFLTPGRAGWPFVYGMCRSEGGEWKAYQRTDDGGRLALDA